MECIVWVNMIGIIVRINVYNVKKFVSNVWNIVKNVLFIMGVGENNCVIFLNYCDCMWVICLYVIIWNSM